MIWFWVCVKRVTIQNAEISTKQNVFQNLFSRLQDPRRTNKGHFYYPLDEILFLVIAAVVSGAEEWVSIQIFGNAKLEWPRRFFPYRHGIPSHDVLGKLFSRLGPVRFNECFMAWVNSISVLTKGEVIAFDGKSICGSGQAGQPKSAVHVVSAYATQTRLCLGQVKVDQKENGIVAIPQMLELLAIKGCIVTIDAMGCQKGIARKIIQGKADYILMVKDNQKELKAQVEKMFRLQSDCPCDQTTDSGHGRVEARTCQATRNLTFMDDKEQWPAIRSVVQVKSERYIKQSGKTSEETRYYITSLEANPVKLNQAVRSHWGIENNLHWSLDMVFNEDSLLKKKDYSATNFNIIAKIALTLLEKESSLQASKKRKRLFSALQDEYREKVLKI
jgi:predicted transposase YbfD/YdcC